WYNGREDNPLEHGFLSSELFQSGCCQMVDDTRRAARGEHSNHSHLEAEDCERRSAPSEIASVGQLMVDHTGTLSITPNVRTSLPAHGTFLHGTSPALPRLIEIADFKNCSYE